MLDQAYEFINSTLSDEGFSRDGFTIKGKAPCCFCVTISGDEIHIDLNKNPLSVSFVKQILFFKPRVTLDAIGVILRKDNGVIKFKNFVDFPFSYK